MHRYMIHAASLPLKLGSMKPRRMCESHSISTTDWVRSIYQKQDVHLSTFNWILICFFEAKSCKTKPGHTFSPGVSIAFDSSALHIIVIVITNAARRALLVAGMWTFKTGKEGRCFRHRLLQWCVCVFRLREAFCMLGDGDDLRPHGYCNDLLCLTI